MYCRRNSKMHRYICGIVSFVILILITQRFGKTTSPESRPGSRSEESEEGNKEMKAEPCQAIFFQKHNIHFYDMSKSNPDCEPATPCVLVKTDRASDFQVCSYPPSLDWHTWRDLQEGRRKPDLANQVVDALMMEPQLGFLDIGASVGVFSLLAASLGRKVLAVDPLHSSVQLMHRAAKLNSVEHLLTLVTNPILSNRRPVALGLVPGNMGGSTIVLGQDDRETQDVTHDSIVADDLIPILPFKSAIMKVTVAGFEIAAMYSASHLLEAVHIPVIFIEWHYIKQAHGLNNLLELLQSHEYTPHRSLNSPQLTADELEHWQQHVVWLKAS